MHQPTPPPDPTSEELPEELVLAFAPLHKRAFGMAVGLVLGLTVFAATVAAMLEGGHGGFLEILSVFFYGYSVSWEGAFIGFAWTVFGGFCMGWFAAFCRNLVIATSIWFVRAREEFWQTRDFLDHI